MKTIEQNVGVIFNAIDLKDAVTMLPLMNGLKKVINCEYARKLKNNLPKEEQRRYAYINPYKLELDLNSVMNIYNILNQLGFVDTIEETPEDILNEHEHELK